MFSHLFTQHLCSNFLYALDRYFMSRWRTKSHSFWWFFHVVLIVRSQDFPHLVLLHISNFLSNVWILTMCHTEATGVNRAKRMTPLVLSLRVSLRVHLLTVLCPSWIRSLWGTQSPRPGQSLTPIRAGLAGWEDTDWSTCVGSCVLGQAVSPYGWHLTGLTAAGHVCSCGLPAAWNPSQEEFFRRGEKHLVPSPCPVARPKRHSWFFFRVVLSSH